MIDINAQRLLARDAQLCGGNDEPLVWMRSLVDRALNDIHTCCPGIIDSFDAESQTVQVKPALATLFFPDGQDAQWVELPPLVDVPIVALSGAGFALTFPVQSGDSCLLLFAERAVDNWYEQGEASVPAIARRHSLSDAFALVGIRSRNNSLENYNTEDVELRSEDGQTKIRLTDSKVFLTQGSNEIQLSESEIKLTSSTVRIEGQLSVSGSVTAQGDVKAGSISLQGHVHGGVYSGGSYTSTPQ